MGFINPQRETSEDLCGWGENVCAELPPSPKCSCTVQRPRDLVFKCQGQLDHCQGWPQCSPWTLAQLAAASLTGHSRVLPWPCFWKRRSLWGKGMVGVGQGRPPSPITFLRMWSWIPALNHIQLRLEPPMQLRLNSPQCIKRILWRWFVRN